MTVNIFTLDIRRAFPNRAEALKESSHRRSRTKVRTATTRELKKDFDKSMQGNR